MRGTVQSRMYQPVKHGQRCIGTSVGTVGTANDQLLNVAWAHLNCIINTWSAPLHNKLRMSGNGDTSSSLCNTQTCNASYAPHSPFLPIAACVVSTVACLFRWRWAQHSCWLLCGSQGLMPHWENMTSIIVQTNNTTCMNGECCDHTLFSFSLPASLCQSTARGLPITGGSLLSHISLGDAIWLCLLL